MRAEEQRQLTDCKRRATMSGKPVSVEMFATVAAIDGPTHHPEEIQNDDET
jgi:hypothetical protein